MKSTVFTTRHLLLCLVFAPLLVFSQSITDNRPIRINAGGPEIHYDDIMFEAGDTYAHTTNGQVFAPNLNGHDIKNTNWDEIYKSESFHKELTYDIPVRGNTCYLVNLHFAEIYFDAPGGRPEPEWGRIFDIIVEGEMKIDDYNIIKTEGSAMYGVSYTYEVCLEGDDDEINLYFPSRSDHAKISAIEILPACGDNCLDDEITFPVELLDFEGKIDKESIVLTWLTAWEENNAGFEIQRSSNGKQFATISFVEGKGSSNDLTVYELKDSSPLNGRNYYRLKQIDLNGSTTYSSIIEISVNLSSNKLMAIYPNPAPLSATVTIKLNARSSLQPINIYIRDINGQTIQYHKLHADSFGSVAEKLGVVHQLTTGIYFVVVDDGSGVQTQRLIIL